MKPKLTKTEQKILVKTKRHPANIVNKPDAVCEEYLTAWINRDLTQMIKCTQLSQVNRFYREKVHQINAFFKDYEDKELKEKILNLFVLHKPQSFKVIKTERKNDLNSNVIVFVHVEINYGDQEPAQVYIIPVVREVMLENTPKQGIMTIKPSPLGTWGVYPSLAYESYPSKEGNDAQ